jgi:uncharacterized protein (TIGR02147 family)
MESLFAYTDYRRYLRDYFTHMKTAHNGFSLRTLSDRAGFRARDYLLRVMNGARNLSKSGMYKLSRALRLSEKEADYFENLVAMNQARTLDEKRHFYARLSRIGKHVKQQRLRGDQFSILSEWHHCAIRSLLPVADFKDDYAAIGAVLDPPVSAAQARKSVELLLSLGLLARNADGSYSVAAQALSTGDEVRSVALTEFHNATLSLAGRSLGRHLPRDRDISGVTMSLSAEGFAKVRNEIRALRQRVMEIAAEDTGEDRVCHLNVHLFPLTRIGALS